MYIQGKCGQLNNYNVKSVGIYKYTFIFFLKLDEYWTSTHIRLIHSVAVWEKHKFQNLLLPFIVNTKSFIISFNNTDWFWLLYAYFKPTTTAISH